MGQSLNVPWPIAGERLQGGTEREPEHRLAEGGRGGQCAKTLSICILTFNRLETLKETLASIVPQLGNDDRAEIVICDNASTDGTNISAPEYTRVPLGVRYHRNQENLGFDGNVVSAVNQAQGEYVAFFSDDDVALPGTYQYVLEEIRTKRPAVVYLNHYPFRNNDPCLSDALKLPAVDIEFTNGKEFFLFAGLGFISSLIVRTDHARHYLAHVRRGQGYAHLDIAARVCLFEQGPFLYLGTKPVAARIPTRQVYDWLTGCGIAEAQFYHNLEAEGVLDPASVRRRAEPTIRDHLVGLVLLKKCLGDYRHLDCQRGLCVSTRMAGTSPFGCWSIQSWLSQGSYSSDLMSL